MQYRNDKYGNPISQLGYGCMRFTKKGAAIDFEKAEAEILHGVESGINYYDTAYLYPGNEECLGRIVEKNGLREKIKIATKLPQYMMKSSANIEKTFREELKRLRTDYIDYYLMHMFTDPNEWEHLKSIGIEDFIKRHQEDGSIRQIGFSYHGNSELFLKILDAYDWDFCQIQYNYLDEHSQAGRIGLEAAYQKGIPVIIMEPLRGGKLVNMLPDGAKKAIADSERGYSAAEWGLRWLWNQPGVTCVLSGMNSMEMLDENIRIASLAQAGEFTDSDFKTIEDIKTSIKAGEKVGCTGCGYCMPCPKGVDIPGNFHYYNLTGIDKKADVCLEFARNLGMRKEPAFASQCIECGKCEKHCPQKIEIRKKLKEADKALRPWYLRAAISVFRMFYVKKEKKK